MATIRVSELGSMQAYSVSWSLGEVRGFLGEKITEGKLQPGDTVELYSGKGCWDSRLEYASEADKQEFKASPELSSIVGQYADKIAALADVVRELGMTPVLASCSCSCYWQQKMIVADRAEISLIS